MKTLFLYALLIACIVLTACGTNNKHFLTNSDYREQVHQQFVKRQEMAKGRSEQLFSVFNQDLTNVQREALEFLYAYMPLSDLADYDGTFFLAQVNAAFQARDYFKWGKSIPEDIFRHFVLVYRVNNETLDTARPVFFNELKDRVKNLSMAEAALEVNHWCHEKMNYRPTDGRTSSPLASLRTSWGRCGEESTFAVTALRSVGIPARQCYTPRWAHTDDNHAWVEVWVDGKWHYMGACEPEPEFDIAWFSAPIKRAMMVHTNVFGQYTGPEEKNFTAPLYSKINLLSNYTNTKILTVKVVDSLNNPVSGATVKFKLYNYAELYSLADMTTDEKGIASVITGFGDLIVWGQKENVYGYAKASSVAKDTLVVQLSHAGGEVYDKQIELVPPVEQKITELSAEQQQQNAKRLAREDSIRNAYMATFIQKEAVLSFAQQLKIDTANTWKYLQLSQGNWIEIRKFIEEHHTNSHLFPFLASLSEKDLRDADVVSLNDHFNNAARLEVSSPRIANEFIRPWRSFLQSKFDSVFAQQAVKDPQTVVEWIRKNIQVTKDENYYNCPLSPTGVFQLKMADPNSRNIFFVALCRSLNIPARIEFATGVPQYFKNNNWNAVVFEQAQTEQTVKATVTLRNAPSNIIKPAYATHYSIAHYKDGDFKTLDYEGDPLVKNFPCKLAINPGYYKVMMCTRANDGSVTMHNYFFNLTQGQSKDVEIKLPELTGKLQVLGIIDMNTTIQLVNNTSVTLKDLANKKGLVLCFADPGKEPTRHVLNDIPVLKTAFEKWGGGMVFMVSDDKLTAGFDPASFKELPQQTVWAKDAGRKLLNNAAGTLQLNFQNNFPLTLFLTADGKILFSSEGYRIGIGENIIKAIQLQSAMQCTVK